MNNRFYRTMPHKGSSVAANHLSMAGNIRSKVQNLIFRLDDLSGYTPGRLDDCLDELRPLFDAEEVLMIQTRYPDYQSQVFAHRSFLRRMTQERKTRNFREMELHAAEWLACHEQLGGTMFHLFLGHRHNEKDATCDIMNCPLPDNVILSAKIVDL